MAIGSSISPPPVSDVALGLRGAISLGSGLRGGVVLVNRVVERSAAIEEERRLAEEAALKAQEEQSRVEEQESARQAGADTEDASQDDAATSQAIDAAVSAGQSGDVTPRGAFLDVSV